MPVVIYEHHIDRKDPLQRYMDPDNIDTKRVTDCLQGYMIEDDTALSLSQFQIGVLDDESYAKVLVLPGASFPRWALDNAGQFVG